jgi:hypothetical protein
VLDQAFWEGDIIWEIERAFEREPAIMLLGT